MKHAVSLKLSMATEQPAHADVVIVGGGVIGVSVAWHLAAAGVKNIVVIEKSRFGKGSSAKPLGGVRANFSDPANIALGKRSLERFQSFKEDFGIDIGLHKVGYLFLARSNQEAESLVHSTDVQNSMGVEARVVDPQEAAEINPFLDPKALTAAAYSPNDGYAEPARVVAGYIAAASKLGVTFLDRTEVLAVRVSAGDIQAVETSRGEISCGALINCAGAWGGKLSARVGVEMPIQPVRRMIGITAPAPANEPNPTVPFTLDLSTTMYHHNAGKGMLIGISHQEQPSFDRQFDFDWLEEYNAAAKIIAPSLYKPTVVKGWAGLYENTPDHNAFIGQDTCISNYFYATGFSGHGFLQAPAVGELMADLYLGRPSFMDPSPFHLSRISTPERCLREVNII